MLLHFLTFAFVVVITFPFGKKRLEMFTASPSNPPGFERKSKIKLVIPCSFKLINAFFTSNAAFSLNLVKTI